MKHPEHRLWLLLFLMPSAVLSQEFRASIAGEVTDPAGAPVVEAKIIVTSLERNVPTEAVSNAAGRYLVQFLLPGKYTLTVEKGGFKKFVREGITLTTADRVALDVRLELGALAESITVTAEAPLLQTETASRAALVENRLIENIPTSGRNLYQLQYSLPGVMKASSYWGDFELYAFGNINDVIISGGRVRTNVTLIDGVPDGLPDMGVAYAPALQAVQEFTLHTNIYDAQFGRLGGGVTSITTKSGTNALHGQLFEFLENEKLYASDWLDNALGRSKTPFKLNTFGFEFDGPVYLPKLYDGRHRAFFMISLESLRERNPGSQVRTLPTAEQMRGDFSGLFNASGRPVILFDPRTTLLGPDGRTYIRTPFQNNRIPQDRINPVAAKVAAFYPEPNRPGIGPDNQINYNRVTASKNGYDSWLGKMDYRISDRSSVSFRHGQTPWTNFSRIAWGTNAAEPSGEAPDTRISRLWGMDWTYTLNPRTVFSLRAGLARFEDFDGNIFAQGFDPRQLGFPDRLVSQFTALQFPRFNLGRYSELGATRVSNYATHDHYSLQPGLIWTRGRHVIKYGAGFSLFNRNQIAPGAASGTYNFDKRWTQRNPQQGDAESGDEFAAFLLGLPVGGSVERNIDTAYQNKYYTLYFQDDWKVSPKLTLNVGLRWDYETPRVERFNRMVRGFAFDQASPIASRAPQLNLRGGLLYAGSSGSARQAFFPDQNNFQPRAGVAWQFAPKWVLRGGYGLTYLGQSANGGANGFSRPTALSASTDNFITPAVTLSDPYPSSLWPAGLLQPVGNSLGLATDMGFGIAAQYLDRPLPYSHQFSVGFQREMPRGFLLDFSYVGNITRKLPVGLGLNFIPTQSLNSLPVDQRPAFFNAGQANPLAGLFSGGAINGATVPRSQLLVAYPQFSGVTITDVPIGRQRYDSFQIKATRRFASGLGMQVSYTLSKTYEQVGPLNAQDVVLNNLLATPLEKRLIEFDVPHLLALVTSYELPFGRGKRYGPNMHPALNAMAGGWNLNTQWVMRSGLPLEFPNAPPLGARTARLNHGQRDELGKARGGQQFDVFFDHFFDTSLWRYPTAPFFRRQAPFTLRDFPTRFADARTKALNISEISVSKDFPIKERVRLQIRADLQNAFNYPFFGRLQARPNDVANSRFGFLEPSSRSEEREIILVMKLFF